MAFQIVINDEVQNCGFQYEYFTGRLIVDWKTMIYLEQVCYSIRNSYEYDSFKFSYYVLPLSETVDWRKARTGSEIRQARMMCQKLFVSFM